MNEVMRLLARIQVEVQSAGDAVTQLRAVEEELRSLGAASERELAKLSRASDEIVAQMQRVGESKAALAQVEQQLQTLETSVGKAANIWANYTQGVTQAETAVTQLADAFGIGQDRLGSLIAFVNSGVGSFKNLADNYGIAEEDALALWNAVKLMTDGFETLDPKTKRIIELFKEWQEETKKLASEEAKLAGETDQGLGTLEQFINLAQQRGVELGSVSREQQNAAETSNVLTRALQNTNLSFEQMGQLMRVLISGRASLSTFGSLMGRFVVRLAPVLALLSPLIATFGIFRSRIGQLAVTLENADPAIRETTSSLNAMGNVDLSATLGQLDTLSNRLESFGFINADAVAGQIGTIAQNIQGLNATPGDLNQTISQIQQAVESTNLSALRDFDLDIDFSAAQEQINEIRRTQGEAAAQAETIGILMAAGFDRAAESGRAVTAEMSTMQGIVASLRNEFDTAVNESENFQRAMAAVGDLIADIVDGIEDVLPPLLTFASFLADKVAEMFLGVEALWNTVLATLNIGARGFATLLEGAVNAAIDAAGTLLSTISGGLIELDVPDLDLSGFKESADAMRDVRLGAVETVIVLQTLRESTEAVDADPIGALVYAFEQVNEKGTLTVDAIERFQRATNTSNRDVLTSIGIIQDNAAALGLNQRQIAAMSDAYVEWERRVGDVSDALPQVERSLEDIRQSAMTFVQDAGGARGVVGALERIGEASINLREDASPANALRFFEAYQQGISEALDGGAQKIEAFRQFVEEALRPQLSNEEYEALISVVESTEQAFAPLAREADNLAGAAVSAGDRAQTTAGQIADLDGNVRSADSAVQGLTSSLEDFSSRDYTTRVGVEFDVGSFPNVAGFNIPITGGSTPLPGSGGSSGSPAASQAAADAAAARRAADQASRDATLAQLAQGGDAQAELARFSSIRDRAETVTTAVRSGAETTFDLLNDRGGRGGGGGGGGDAGLDVEEIRQFLQEVNRAISIASREGVRIGTAGNAIPFEEGSFLNAEGGGLSVDTILIRGVWDFADPAAKRQIINELQEALESLQAEV